MFLKLKLDNEIVFIKKLNIFFNLIFNLDIEGIMKVKLGDYNFLKLKLIDVFL